MIRITAEINTYSWRDEALVYKLWQQIIELSFIKHLVRVINKDYDRSVKESSLSPPGGIHIQESTLASTYHQQHGEIKLWVLNYTQQDLPDRRKKDSKDKQGYLACGFIASAGALLKVCPYIQFLLADALVHYSM